MGVWDWISQNWFNLFGSAGVAGLWFAVHSLHEETKARRVANRIALTMNHRDLWSECFRNRQLRFSELAVLQKRPGVSRKPLRLAPLLVGS